MVPSTQQITSSRSPSTSAMARQMEITQRLSNISMDDGQSYEIATHIVKVWVLVRQKAALYSLICR